MDILEEVKLILKELAESQKETNAELRQASQELKELGKETDRRFQETDLKFQETDLKFQETNRELKETSRLVKELTRNINGIADSNGLSAEQFFSSALEKSPALNGVNFDVTDTNCKRHDKMLNIREQYDVLLYSPTAVGIVEIKHRLRSADIEVLASRKITNFRTLFPQEASKDIYLAAAGLSVDDQAVERASELGVYVMTQLGEGIKILNTDARVF